MRLLALAVLLFVGNANAQPRDPKQWQAEITSLVAGDAVHPPPQHAVLFVGSSSIRLWTTLAEDIPGVPAINRGFGGSRIADSTYYADRIVVPYHPKLIIMYAGDNDVAEGRTPRQVIDDFKDFVARVRRDLPDVAIAYLSIKPSVARAATWPQMRVLIQIARRKCQNGLNGVHLRHLQSLAVDGKKQTKRQERCTLARLSA
jgi:hypothetical protein